jgi:hypothetical protein
MRTEANISSTLSNAKIAYSYRINTMEELRERGLNEGSFLGFFKGTNIFYALDTDLLSNDDKSILCDALVRNGYVTATNQLMFSEEIYNEDFDRV